MEDYQKEKARKATKTLRENSRAMDAVANRFAKPGKREGAKPTEREGLKKWLKDMYRAVQGRRAEGWAHVPTMTEFLSRQTGALIQQEAKARSQAAAQHAIAAAVSALPRTGLSFSHLAPSMQGPLRHEPDADEVDSGLVEHAAVDSRPLSLSMPRRPPPLAPLRTYEEEMGEEGEEEEPYGEMAGAGAGRAGPSRAGDAEEDEGGGAGAASATVAAPLRAFRFGAGSGIQFGFAKGRTEDEDEFMPLMPKYAALEDVPPSIADLREKIHQFLTSPHKGLHVFQATVFRAYVIACKDPAVGAKMAHTFLEDLDMAVRIADQHAFLFPVQEMDESYNMDLFLNREAVRIEVLFANSPQRLIATYGTEFLGTVPTLAITIPTGCNFKIHPSALGRPPYTALANEIMFLLHHLFLVGSILHGTVSQLFPLLPDLKANYLKLQSMQGKLLVKSIQERAAEHKLLTERKTPQTILKTILEKVGEVVKQTTSTTIPEAHRLAAIKKLDAMDVLICKAMTELLMTKRDQIVSVPVSVMRFRVWNLRP